MDHITFLPVRNVIQLKLPIYRICKPAGKLFRFKLKNLKRKQTSRNTNLKSAIINDRSILY